MYSIVSSLRKIFRPILRVLGMSSTPLPDEFPLRLSRITVNEWQRNLLNLYLYKDVGINRVKSCKVTTIRHYKDNDGPEHQYLVAEVSVCISDSTSKRYLQIHRVANPNQRAPNLTPSTAPNPATERSSIRSTLTSSSQSSQGISKDLPADDQVFILERWPSNGNFGLVEELNCENDSIYLLDLCILATLVHDHRAIYRALGSQCYWYSDLISAVLQMKFRKVTRRGGPKNCGTYGLAPIYTRNDSLVKTIHATFEERKSELFSSVCLLNTGYISAD
jgi:hypothetical protein